MVTNSFLVFLIFDYHYSFMGFHGCVSVNIISLFGAQLVTALFILHQLMDIWVLSASWLLGIIPLWTSMYKFLYTRMFSFLSGVYWRVELLVMWKLFLRPSNLFHKRGAPFYEPSKPHMKTVHPHRHLFSLWPF